MKITQFDSCLRFFKPSNIEKNDFCFNHQNLSDLIDDEDEKRYIDECVERVLVRIPQYRYSEPDLKDFEKIRQDFNNFILNQDQNIDLKNRLINLFKIEVAHAIEMRWSTEKVKELNQKVFNFLGNPKTLHAYSKALFEICEQAELLEKFKFYQGLNEDSFNHYIDLILYSSQNLFYKAYIKEMEEFRITSRFCESFNKLLPISKDYEYFKKFKPVDRMFKSAELYKFLSESLNYVFQLYKEKKLEMGPLQFYTLYNLKDEYLGRFYDVSN